MILDLKSTIEFLFDFGALAFAIWVCAYELGVRHTLRKQGKHSE
jgi:hypothetical protein